MKIYRGMEIMEVIDLMDKIVYSTSLTEAFEDGIEHNYRELAEVFPEMLATMICFVADDMQSFLFADINIEEYKIEVVMWAGMNNKIGFKQTMQYFNALRNIFKDEAKNVTIEADCRTTTSLPIVNKLDGKKGIHVTNRGQEYDGFVKVTMMCETN